MDGWRLGVPPNKMEHTVYIPYIERVRESEREREREIQRERARESE